MFFSRQDIKKFLLVFFCCFPFIGLNIGTDVQPFAFAISAAILFMGGEKYISNKYSIPYAICITTLFVFSLFNVSAFTVIKRMFSYVSVLIIPMAVEKSGIDIDEKRFERTMKVVMLTWLTAALLQFFFVKNLFHQIVPSMRIDEGQWRGATSLASEPSFYAYMCFFFFLIAMDFKKHRALFMSLMIIQTLLLAQSSVGIIYFVVFFILYGIRLLKNLRREYLLIILAAILCVVVGIIFVKQADPRHRIIFLLQSFLDGNTEIWKKDVSLFLRLTAVTRSFANKGMPSPMGVDYIVAMSGFGSAFFELGVFSAFLYMMVGNYIWNAYPKGDRWVVLLSVSVSMFSAIQLSSPMFGFFLGYCQLKAIKRNKESMKQLDFDSKICGKFKVIKEA